MHYVIIVIIIIIAMGILGWLWEKFEDAVLGFIALAAVVGLFFLVRWLIKKGIMIILLRVASAIALAVFGCMALWEIIKYYKYAKANQKINKLIQTHIRSGELDHKQFKDVIRNNFDVDFYDPLFRELCDDSIIESADKQFLTKTEKLRLEAYNKAENEFVNAFKTLLADEVLSKKEILDHIANIEHIRKCFSNYLKNLDDRLNALYLSYYQDNEQKAKNEFTAFADESFITQKFSPWKQITENMGSRFQYAKTFIQEIEPFFSFCKDYYENMICSILSAKVKDAGAMVADELIDSITAEPVNNFFSDMERTESIEKCEQMLSKDITFEKTPINDKTCIGKFIFVNPAGGKNLIRHEIELN